jgi:hypothetical protein
MSYALTASLFAALLLACLVRAARPGGLLEFLGDQYEAWQIFKPKWLPDAVTGGCILCTTFWWLGLPVALLVALTGGGWWSMAVPCLVAVLSEILILL